MRRPAPREGREKGRHHAAAADDARLPKHVNTWTSIVRIRDQVDTTDLPPGAPADARQTRWFYTAGVGVETRYACWHSSDAPGERHPYLASSALERAKELFFGKGTLTRVEAACEEETGLGLGVRFVIS